MTKQQQLDNIADEIAHCPICPIGKSGKPVPGEGNPDARIVFLGEAPGKTEAVTGRPFVGRSGKLLRSLLHDVGLKEEDVYITSPVKYLPDRGTPTKADIAHGKVHLDKQLAVIDPDVVVLLGATACFAMLGKEVSITKEHGTIKNQDDRTYFLTYHPSAALRFPKFKEALVHDFQTLRQVVASTRDN